MSTNRQWRLPARSDRSAAPTSSSSKPSSPSRATDRPGDGQFVVAVTEVSIDPAMRGWMNVGRSYIPPVKIGEVMRALTLGVVISSRNKQFAEDDVVHGTFGVQEYALSDGAGVHKITPADGLSLSAYLGVLGMTGMAAYYPERYPAAVAELSRWLLDGRLRSIEDTVRADIGTFPDTLARLFTGANTGKIVLELQ